MLIHSEEFGYHNLIVFTFLKAVLTPHSFGHLAHADQNWAGWKEDELAVIDCRPIIGVFFDCASS